MKNVCQAAEELFASRVKKKPYFDLSKREELIIGRTQGKKMLPALSQDWELESSGVEVIFFLSGIPR